MARTCPLSAEDFHKTEEENALILASFAGVPGALGPGTPSVPLETATRGPRNLLSQEEVDAWEGCTTKGEPKRLPDGNRLFVIQRSPSGKKVWRKRVTYPDGHEDDITLGDADRIGVTQARALGLQAEQFASGGLSLKVYRDVLKAEVHNSSLTLGVVADMWFNDAKKAGIWKTEKGANEVRWRLDKWLKTHAVWKVPFRQASVALTVQAINRCAQSSVSQSVKLRGNVREIAKYAIQAGIAEASPLATIESSLEQRGYKKKLDKGNNYPALFYGPAVGELLYHNENSHACWQVIKATWLQANVFQRSGNVASMRWAHIDWAQGLWIIPRKEMKEDDQSGGGTDMDYRAFHIVPLSPQVRAMLRTLRRESEYVFYSTKDINKHITPNTLVNHMKYRLGMKDQHTPHGWRSTASTYLNAQTTPQGKRKYDRDDIEIAQDHKVGNAVMRIYNRGVAVERLTPLFYAYSDALDVLLNEARDRHHAPADARATKKKGTR